MTQEPAKISSSETSTGTEESIRGIPLIEIRKGVKRGDDNTAILKDIDIELYRGERLAIVGQTGSGKTVVLRSIALLDPLDEGELLWKGKPVSNSQVPEYRKNVIYIHQNPVLFEGTVISNIKMPFSFRSSQPQKFDITLVKDMIADLGFSNNFLARSQRDLSGGERQIVAILRAIQLKPAVLLLDEPTSALDRNTTAAVERLVMKWKEEMKHERAYIWVSHSPEQVERITDRHLEIVSGKISGGKG